jgi:carbamoyl-phosphate synthase large subunit
MALNLLVLGVGGNVSQGILKALSISRLDCRLIGACVSPHAPGLFVVDRAYLSPPAAAPAFLDWLIETCRAERVHGILSGVEPVLDVLAVNRARIVEESGAVPIVSPVPLLEVCNDKLRTSRWLEQNGFGFARSADAAAPDEVDGLVGDIGFPLIAKPRKGKGAHGIRRVDSRADLRAVTEDPVGYVIQEYLGTPAEEYTAATFTDRTGVPRGAIIMRRELAHGTTVVAEAGDYPDVRAEVLRIATALRPTGPCNVQLRLTPRGPVCFEINLRFSGTTAMRAHFGFNDVEAAVRHYILGEPAVDLPHIASGVAVRYWAELYLDPAGVGELTKAGCLAAPYAHLVGRDVFGGERS